MSTPDPTPDRSPAPAPPPGLPPAPWILIDRTTVEQAAVAFERLEQWLAGADPDATTDCAHTCSRGEADPFEVAAWVGTLAAHLQRRIDISDAGMNGAEVDGAEVDGAEVDGAEMDGAEMDPWP
jgi:hypothetical protein